MKKKRSFFIAFIVVIIGIVFLLVNENIKNENRYNYKIEKGSNYNVFIKPSNFYEETFLLADGYYPSKAIDYFKFDFNYKFKGNKDAEIKYKYKVVANLIGNSKTSNNQDVEVWNKEFQLFESNLEKCKNEIIINKTVFIDYEYYNDLARSYEIEYGISLDAVLKVRLIVEYDINSKYFVLNKNNDEIELEIPLTNTITQITENYERNFCEEIPIKEVSFYGFVGAFLIILETIFIFFNIIRRNASKNKLEEFLKKYKDLIIKLKEKPNLSRFEIIKLDNIKDLISVVEQNQENILLFTDLIEKKTELCVLVDGIAYYYQTKDVS